MGSEMCIRDRIKSVLLSEIENYGEALQAEEVGEVLEVKDGIARIYGLTKAMANEMLEIMPADSDEPVTALALNLEEDNIGAVILGDWTSLHEGDQVRRTGRGRAIPAGPASPRGSDRRGRGCRRRARRCRCRRPTWGTKGWRRRPRCNAPWARACWLPWLSLRLTTPTLTDISVAAYRSGSYRG